MSDIFTKAKRSEVMARIRSRGNKATELALAKLFRRHRITGWRRQGEIRKAESGKQKFKVKADFIFPKHKLAVFVDGCFWHGCPRHGTQPKGNAAFWRRKIARNRARDKTVNRTLRKLGWRVLRIWEHALRRATKKNIRATPHPNPLPIRCGEGEARLVRRVLGVLRD